MVTVLDADVKEKLIGLEAQYAARVKAEQETEECNKQNSIRRLRTMLDEELAGTGIDDLFSLHKFVVDGPLSNNGKIYGYGIGVDDERYGNISAELIVERNEHQPSRYNQWILPTTFIHTVRVLSTESNSRYYPGRADNDLGQFLKTSADAVIANRRRTINHKIEGLKDIIRNIQNSDDVVTRAVQNLEIQVGDLDDRLNSAYGERKKALDEEEERKFIEAEDDRRRAEWLAWLKERDVVWERNAKRLDEAQTIMDSVTYNVATITYAITARDEEGAWYPVEQSEDVLIEDMDDETGGLMHFWKTVDANGRISQKRYTQPITVSATRAVVASSGRCSRDVLIHNPGSELMLRMPPYENETLEQVKEELLKSLEPIPECPDLGNLSYWKQERIKEEALREYNN